MSGIVFQVDTVRVLSILANEIYDSPLAMLRENLQNAYDAIRERFAVDGNLQTGGKIDVIVSENQISITDNGVGMNEDVLRNNFWKAGSSGKNSESARKAGVVGTFGIGAMANFGVCSKLVVETRSINEGIALRSAAELSTLKIGEECISFEKIAGGREIGTTVIATLKSENQVSAQAARDYLKPYVEMLPVPVFLNGDSISGKTIDDFCRSFERAFHVLGTLTVKDNVATASCEVSADANGQVLVRVRQIAFSGVPVEGSLALLQGGGQLMGFRSYFGLAPIPAIGHFQFGGVANLGFLHPTAGRDAISRESIEWTNKLVGFAELAAAEVLAKSEHSDNNQGFLNWVSANNRFELAGNVTVLVHPSRENVAMQAIPEYRGGRGALYYLQNSPGVISTFANENTIVLQVSQNYPRRKIQQFYIQSKLGISQVPNSAQILKIYEYVDLNYVDGAILVSVAATLREDYFISDAEIKFADISHGVMLLAQKDGEKLTLFIAKNSPALTPLKELYSTAYTLFGQFIKDYVRANLYPSIQQYVPSSTKEGVDVLRRLLAKGREVYRIEESDRGEIEGILGEYLSGEVSFSTVLSLAMTKPQSQRVSQDQVGSIESAVPDISQVPPEIIQSAPNDQLFIAAPPIMREAISSNMKILTSNVRYPLLHDFNMFLGLSDKLMRTEGDFFVTPHTTRVIWGGHRVVYIFTEASETLSLYYDIELKNQIDASQTGGGMFQTTTLITKERVFIPIPDVLHQHFQVGSTPKEFVVRFDVLSAGIAH